MRANRDARKQKANSNKFFDGVGNSNSSLGGGRLGERRRLFSRRGKLRLAEQLRKRGFGRAAEAVALDYARSPEASAPSIMTPELRAKMEQDSETASQLRSMNEQLIERLMGNSGQDFRGGKRNRNRNRNRLLEFQGDGGALASDRRLGLGNNSNRSM